MGQNILVAFDDSPNAMRAIEFIVKAFTPQNKITLFHVIQNTAALCEMNSPELSDYFLSQQTAFCALEDKKKRLVDIAMEKAKAICLDSGFEPDDVTLKVEAKKKGIARDIVDEAQFGYDIIVIGRRGISAVKEFFFGSVSQKVVNGVKDVSVLIVN
jgi:nucleotide-binding universal stress UspA family protein